MKETLSLYFESPDSKLKRWCWLEAANQFQCKLAHILSTFMVIYSLWSTVVTLKKWFSHCPSSDIDFTDTHAMRRWTLWYTVVVHTKSSSLCLKKTVLNKDTEGAIIAQSDGWAVGWNVKLPWPPLWFKKVLFLEGGHAVIEVFTTRQKCDGTENVGDSDAWLNRLLCTDCRAALWIVMLPFIVLRLKGSPIRERHYSTPCSFWYRSPQNKDYVSKARRSPTDTLIKLKMHCDRTLTKTDRQKDSFSNI